jgi:hypothetical protein
MAVFGHDGRYLNNDIDCLHERLLLDVAAGMRFLRDAGYETIIGVGNSGGGSLFGYYQEQAERQPRDRRNAAPSGDPVDLAGADMSPFDLYVGLAAHPGQGNYLLQALDPSVVDEGDPQSWDASLDMYFEPNGYRRWPEPSTYAEDWLNGYREAQQQRCRKLDAIAREAIADRGLARALAGHTGTEALTGTHRDRLRRRAKLWR